MRRKVWWIVGFVVLSAVVGGGAGVLWERFVVLPGYTVAEDGSASTNERGLSEVIGGDAWFCLLGFLVALGLGMVAWRWFSAMGWPLVLIAVFGAVVAALVCWVVGYRLGPGPFYPRLAGADPGDFVPIELTVRARASVVVWAFGATIVPLLRSSLGRDDEEPRPLFKRRARA